MGFSDAVRTCLFEKYVTFSGRASRSEFWWFMLFYFLLMVVMVVVAAFSLGGLDYLLDPFVFSDGTSTVVVVILGLAFVALYIPVLAATFRRFHDRDLSGPDFIGFRR